MLVNRLFLDNFWRNLWFLVAITPAAGFVDVPGALVIGAVAPLVSYFAIYYLKAKLGYDDALDVFGIHGMSGIWGAIATGIFAAPYINEAAGLLLLETHIWL